MYVNNFFMCLMGRRLINMQDHWKAVEYYPHYVPFTKIEMPAACRGNNGTQLATRSHRKCEQRTLYWPFPSILYWQRIPYYINNRLQEESNMPKLIVFHSGNTNWNSCRKAIGVANDMKERSGAKLDVKVLTTDSEEAKGYTFKSSTNVLFRNDLVPLDVATDKSKMETFLSQQL